ncbi:putative galacturonosyltransferase 10 [Acorus gramineus]|uniref:Hexosyltransferase n=1 Tax=Acorus gramineus TaxID=55184 RepID=A0AAV9BU72_ACOGR|nr:putative galacturonosyltransferase 10 [Acorus gramineus]
MARRLWDARRPTRRRWWSSKGFWLSLGGLVFVFFFIVFVLVKMQPRSGPSIAQQNYHRHDTRITEDLSITEEMLSPFSISRQIGDQIALAKALVIIAKESNNLQFASDLATQIRRSQSLLSSAVVQQTPLTAKASAMEIRNMAYLIYQAQQLHYDSASTVTKLTSRIQSLEERLTNEQTQVRQYSQAAAEEIPKSLYCVGVRLSAEWSHNLDLQRKLTEKGRVADKLRDNNLQHFCVFSDNILATSVVVNSTAVNSNHPDRIVFHLVTDEVNYPPMKAWFSMNSFRGVTVEVQKVEDFRWLNHTYVPVLKQLQDLKTQKFYFGNNDDKKVPIKFRNPKYLSMLNHLRFYIPEVYPSLKKIVFLDDDVVVQKDLSQLFSIDLNGNVIGAVETCLETFHRFHKYLNFSNPIIRGHFDPDACGWAYGMNVFDLVEWRKRDVTGIYHYWQERNSDHTLWQLGTLPPGLLTFYGLVEPLDRRWHVLGLGYKDVEAGEIRDGAVLHFNGNLKPWLKIGKEKYKGLWERYLNYSHHLLQQCNLH